MLTPHFAITGRTTTLKLLIAEDARTPLDYARNGLPTLAERPVRAWNVLGRTGGAQRAPQEKHDVLQ
jgi:hypothetical protein